MLILEKQILKNVKQNVRLCTSAALPGPNVYANGANLQPQYGTGGVGATLTGPAATALGNIDGVAPVVGDRILVNNEATAANNGIYVVTALGGVGAYTLTRASDADTSLKLAQASCTVTAGATNGGKIAELLLDTVVTPLVVGTTAVTFAFVLTAGSVPQTSNKGMVANVTVGGIAPPQLATATGITVTPVSPAGNPQYVEVRVNGQGVLVGNGTQAADCYFSSVASAGAAARAFGAIVATDQLYWNGTIAGYQLATTDQIDFLYNA
jgi:hypothetical protein